MRRIATMVVALSLLSVTGCVVGKSKYEAVVKQRDDLKVELGKVKENAAETKADLKSKIQARDDRIGQLEDKKAGLEQKLQEAQGTLEMYESETGSLEEKLDTTKKQLAELREQQREQKKRLEKYRDLAKKLADTFESGELSVKVRDGKMVIEMRDDVLFDSGRAELNESGQEVLTQLADVLGDIQDREFLIAGHTDDVPISSGRFEDNWELSATRASNVVRLLSDEGVDPESLAAAGFSEFDPVASNETEDGRAKNRRIEIILMPKVSELPELPKDLVDES